MMDTKAVPKNDSERSDDEKVVIAQDEEKAGITVDHTRDLPPDPDAHLSVEERAAIV